MLEAVPSFLTPLDRQPSLRQYMAVNRLSECVSTMERTTIPPMSLIALVMAVLAVPMAAWSAESIRPETPTLTVVATGSVTAPPDTAFVTLGMDSAGKSLSEAQRQNSAAIQKVLERLKELKI